MKERKNAWSFTRSLIWNECQKKYYYSYVKRYGDDDLAYQIKRLHQYRSIYLFKGELIHQSIANYITNNQCGIKYNLDASTKSAAEKIRKHYSDNMCLENLNNAPMPESADAVTEDIRSCINTFEKRFWPVLSQYKYAGVEKSYYFNLGEWKATGKIDYLATDKDKMIVVDWKSGSCSQNDATQALIYCMCIMHEFDIPEENVHAEVAYLSAGKKGIVRPVASKVQSMEARIIGECEEISSLDNEPEGNPSDKCIFCQYYTLCEDHANLSSNKEKAAHDTLIK